MGFEEYKPTIVLIACQFMYSGVTLTSRAALLQNMSSMVFIVYRQSIALLFIAPIVYFARRGTWSFYLGWKNFLLIFLISFFGVTAFQNAYFGGVYLASSSAASALYNLVPAITFIMAYTTGLEKLRLRSLTSAAKIIGTTFCVAGALVMALLKGPKLLNMEFTNSTSLLHQGGHDTWLLGCLLLFTSSCFWSLYLILQVHVSASYPDHLSLTAWMCLIGGLQSGILALIFEPDIKAWKLNSPLEIICCIYSGLVSAVTIFAQAWCISRRGPVFSALFNPLLIVIVTVYACIFMHEELYTGSLVGALAVITGLYVVLWGKANDSGEIKEETLTKKQQNYQATFIKKKKNYQATSDAKFSDNTSYNRDLENPLLSSKATNFGGETS